MKNVGIIPPHFLYFLQNEGIDIVDFKSSNFHSKENYDRITVKFPYGNGFLNIQVIFDLINLSFPPDFIIVDEGDFFIDYNEVIKGWNFRESKSLYSSLNRIKNIYSEEQEKRLNRYIIARKHLIGANNSSQFNYEKEIYNYIDRIIKSIKGEFKKYKNIPKSSQFLDIKLTFNYSGKEEILTSIELTYPLNIFIRSREINRAPLLVVTIPISSEMTFNFNLKLPHFISGETINFKPESYHLSDWNKATTKVETNIISRFTDMQTRETVIAKIIESNIGFPIEIDTENFLKLSLYCYYSKIINDRNARRVNSNNNTNSNSKKSMNTTCDCNYLLHFIFSKEGDGKFEFQIVDCDKLKICSKRRLDYGTSERELNNIIHLIISDVLDHMASKRKSGD